MTGWQRPWMQGTYKQRVTAVLALDSQQTLYEICFCDPIIEVRLAAVHRLNQMQEFKRPDCYYRTGAYFGSDEEPPHEEYFSGRIYETDVPDRRISILPYIIPELFLFEIALGDPDKWIAKLAAKRIQDMALLQKLKYRNYDFEIGAYAEHLIAMRKSGIPAAKPSRIPELGLKARETPPKTAPLKAELREHAMKIRNYADEHGFMHHRVKAADIDLAIVAMQQLRDTQLAKALVRLYKNPNYSHRDRIKQYDGTMIHGEITYNNVPWAESAPPAFLRLEDM